MSNRIKLKEIAEVISGYSFRTSLSEYSTGKELIVQAKNITEDLYISEEGLTRIFLENLKTTAIVKDQDVIISARGNFKAGVFRVGLNDVIASSSVYILRPITSKVLPEFLAIYLNSLSGQKRVQAKSVGVVINTILRKNLEDAILDIPSLENQKKTIEIYKTLKKIDQIMTRKKFLLGKISDEILNQFFKK